MLQSRSRMISFRLTSAEYQQIHDLCFHHGIRSVSELTRVAINSLLHQPSTAPAQSSLDARVSDLEARLQALTNELKGINRPK